MTVKVTKLPPGEAIGARDLREWHGKRGGTGYPVIGEGPNERTPPPKEENIEDDPAK